MLEFGTRRFRLRLVFMGTPEFSVPPLERLIRSDYRVVAVYTRPDKASGRGRLMSPSPVKRVALDWNLPVVQPHSLGSAEALAQLVDFQPDVIVVAAFGQILPQAVLDLPRYGCINIHPSLLPRFRGASPVASAILAGDEDTGVSIMLMDAGMDTGPVLIRERAPVSPQDTTGSLTVKLSRVAAGLVEKTLARWTGGEITPEPQNEAEATYCYQIGKSESEIDWHRPAVELWRRVRAFEPWPGSFTRLRGRQLKIIEAVPFPGGSDEAGRVVTVNKRDAFGVCTSDGILGVLQVQLEGKRAMPAADFLRGQRDFMGMILPN
jgi:methionyl-tRNA formyltransferase